MKHTNELYRFVAIITLIACLLAGCSKEEQSESRKKRNYEPEQQTVEDVISLLQKRSQKLGYQNALSELTEIHTIQHNGLTFYRFQQNYKGLPVYGNHLVYVSDENDVCQMITHSIRDLSGEPELTPTVSEETVTGNLSHYIIFNLGFQKIGHPLKITLRQEDLCIFDNTSTSWDYSLPENLRLAYQIRWESYLFLVDAHSGEVLLCESQVRNANSPAILSVSGEKVTVPVHSSGASILMDAKEGICLFDAGEVPYFNPHMGTLFPERLNMVTSSDNIFGNSDDSPENPQAAESVFTVMRRIVRFYRKTLDCRIIPNLMVVFNDSGGTGGENGAGGIVSTCGTEYLYPGFTIADPMAMVSFGYQLSDDITSQLDIAAHEYNHAVSQQVVGWTFRDIRTAMLMEAYCDVMGELTEAALLDKEPDWKNRYRDLQNPAHPVYDFSGDSYEKVVSELHDYSTVISHLAYRMWNGMDGDPAKKIPTQELTTLWYITMLMLPPDADFSDFYVILSMAAELLELTDEQHLCIGDAFQSAEIRLQLKAGSNTCSRNFAIHAMDGARFFSDCDVIIEDRADFLGPVLPCKEPIVVSIDEPQPFDTHLGFGHYMMRIVPDGAEEPGVSNPIMIANQEEDGYVFLIPEKDNDSVTFTVSGYQMVDGSRKYLPVSDARINVFPIDSDDPVCTMTTALGDGTAMAELPLERYRVVVEADGFRNYTQTFTVSYAFQTRIEIRLYSLTLEEESSNYSEGPYRYPEVVEFEADMDYGLYPFPEDFIKDHTGEVSGTVCYVRDKEHYGYTPSETEGEPDVITTPNPYYWWWSSFHIGVEQQIWDYLSVLESEPFNLELVHTKDMGNEWIYVYRYNGKQTVYPVNISGFVPDDGGVCHFAIDISKRPDEDGRIGVEIIAGYGLEPADPQTMKDVLSEVGYSRTSNGTEEIEALTPGQPLKCYFCHVTVYPSGDDPIYPEQILYCDSCYQEMFG